MHQQVLAQLAKLKKYALRILRILGDVDRHTAEDLYQDLCLRMEKRNPPSICKKYLQKACQWIVRDFRRSPAFRHRPSTKDPVELGETVLSPDAPKQINVDDLTPQEREIARLVAHGYSKKEAAEHLGIPEGTCRRVMHQMRKRLRRKYTG